MKVIDLLNKIANGEEVKFKVLDDMEYYCKENQLLHNEYGEEVEWMIDSYWLNKKVEIIEEEKKIPEKNINNYGDLIILGQQDNWLEPTIETDQKINAQLNPYVFEAINENFKDIENKIYEIIDYIKNKEE